MKKVGFTAGTFDMFHIGHLNLLKNARERCDYLIVGVNTDELVEQYKKKSAIICFEERIAIVSSIKFVDETMRIISLDKEISWNIKQYDYIFIGSDWKGNDRWKRTEVIMGKKGVQVIYLPYTETTNSTIIREKLLSRQFVR